MLRDKVIIFVVLTIVKEISNEAFSQDVASGSGMTVVDQVFKPCCVIGNRLFRSLTSAVFNLTNNSLIKIIESNVVLDKKSEFR